MFDRRRTGPQKVSTSIGDGPHIPKALLPIANLALPLKEVVCRLRASAGDLATGWP